MEEGKLLDPLCQGEWRGTPPTHPRVSGVPSLAGRGWVGSKCGASRAVGNPRGLWLPEVLLKQEGLALPAGRCTVAVGMSLAEWMFRGWHV